MKDTLPTQGQYFIPLGSRAEEIARLIGDPTEPLCRHEPLEGFVKLLRENEKIL
jgi:hypothetical protein